MNGIFTGPRGAFSHAAKAVWLCLGVVAMAGLLLSAAIPALVPGAAFGPAAEDGAVAAGGRGGGPGALLFPVRILSVEDAERYRKIFTLQAAGEFAAADDEVAALVNRSLMGHVLAHRYLGPSVYPAGFGELRQWLGAYADHPDAAAVYRLARGRRAKSRALLPRPGPAELGAFRTSRDERAAVRRAAAGHQATPEKRLSVQAAERQSDAAARYFYDGEDGTALALASAKARREDPTAHWTAGLAAWRLGKMAEAAAHFSALAAAEGVDDWNRAAGAFWAARARLANHEPERVNRWLERAARYPRTFYGLLAARALGQTPRYNWALPELDKRRALTLSALPAWRRALALLQIGERRRAEMELDKLRRDANETLTRAIFAVASRADMPELLFRMGRSLRDDEGRPYDGAIYPLPPWQPTGGFAVDRALIFAIMRQESQFQVAARSRAGARGLMQMTPAAARFVGGGAGGADDPVPGVLARLMQPDVNLDLAQRYLAYLLESDDVDGNLFMLAAAYNGGIGNVRRWQRSLQGFDDPLLFIETIPFRETRAYVEKVLANVWMYRLRLGQPAPSLDALAAGDWPIYRPLDPQPGVTIADAKN